MTPEDAPLGTPVFPGVAEARQVRCQLSSLILVMRTARVSSTPQRRGVPGRRGQCWMVSQRPRHDTQATPGQLTHHETERRCKIESVVTILVVLQRSGRVRFATLGVESGSWVGAALRSPRPCAPTRARRHSRRGLLPPAPIQECSPPRRDAGQRRQRRILPAACSFARRRRVHGRIAGKRPGTSSRTAPGRVVARGRRPGGASRGPTSAAGRVLHRPSAHPLIWPASLIGWIGERAHGQLLTRVRARTGWSMRCAPAKRWSRVRIVHRGGLRRTTTDDTPVFASLGRIPGNSGA
jgi:hypothetical protein